MLKKTSESKFADDLFLFYPSLQSHTVQKNTFGNYRFDNAVSGENYVINFNLRHYQFTPWVLKVSDNITNSHLTALPQ